MTDAPEGHAPQLIVIDRDDYRKQRTTMRRFLLAIIIMFALGLGGTGFTVYQIRSTQVTNTKTSQDTHHLLQLFTNATGAKAQAAQRAALQAAIDQISCNNRDDLTALINTLVDKGVLAPGDVDLRRGCTLTTPTTTEPK